MIVVIQCAASKAHNAGHLLTPAGVPVTFVAHTEIAPVDDEHVHARPDDHCGNYQSHVKNNTAITLKSLTLTCSPGGDAQPVTSTSRLYPPLQPGYGEGAYVSTNCRLIRVNESHQSW
jgi:hypothetical protein